MSNKDTYMNDTDIKNLKSDIMKYFIISILVTIILFSIDFFGMRSIVKMDPQAWYTTVLYFFALMSRILAFITSALSLVLIIGWAYLSSNMQYGNMDE